MRWRKHKQIRIPTSPNFLFSLPPFITGGRIQTIVVEPTGGDDTLNVQAAANRLLAIGGGTVRISGEYTFSAPVYIDKAWIQS